MGKITVSAKTLDDAITEALIRLGVTSDMLEYDVIEERKQWVFGNRKQAGCHSCMEETDSGRDGRIRRAQRRDSGSHL